MRTASFGAAFAVLAVAGFAASGPVRSAAPAAAVAASGSTVASLAIPDRVRVGLATDLERLSLPCCGADLRAQAGGTQLALVESFVVEPAVRGGRGVYRLQVAAMKDEQQARHMAAELTRLRGEPTDVVFDAASDLYRVRFGRFADRREAEERSRSLAALGTVGAFVVSERASTLGEGLRVTQGSDSWRVRGRWVAIWSHSDAGVRLASGRYRGRILVYLNDRGTLNLINELPLEDYLRGVVPREMGPEVYDNLDGLKAQAVAARSYAVRNLGEFAVEGYDICATPRCQVYGGRDSEHPVSDRAVAETAGQVLVHDQQPIDAMYSSTCGGHTEDVNVVFPLKNEPYLRAVPCYEAGLSELAGDLAAGAPFPAGLSRRLLPPAAATTAAGVLGARVASLALEAGLPQPVAELSALDRLSLMHYLADWLDLALEAKLFVAEPDVSYALGRVPANWSAEERRLAAYLARLGVLAGEATSAPSEREIEASLLALASLLRVVEPIEGRFAAVADGALEVRVGGAVARYQLPRHLATFRGRQGAMRAAPLALVPGDHLTLYLRSGRLVAVLQRVEASGAAYDRGSRFSSWRHFRSDRELRELVAAAYPGFDYADLEIVERGRSGRVGKMRFEGRDGGAIEVEGLAIRWTLDLPDTLFTAKRLQPPAGTAGWLFTGRGWGHGVGMCQVGAYGMGLRGHHYSDILTHYYSGVSLATLQPVPRERYEALSRGR